MKKTTIYCDLCGKEIYSEGIKTIDIIGKGKIQINITLKIANDFPPDLHADCLLDVLKGQSTQFTIN